MDGNRKKMVYGGVIALCLVGAIVAYMTISGSGAEVPTATDARQDEITQKMNEMQPPQVEAPMPTASRGAVSAPN